ncbi:DNase I-like protein, partial [Trametes cingulata]
MQGVRRRENGITTRAKFKLATLNMRGATSSQEGETRNKWMLLNQVVRDRRIGVLAVQETHLDQTGAGELSRLFGQNVEIFVSADEHRPTGARGVAFLVNKRVLKARECTATEVVPGRAMLLSFKWSADANVTLLNVYAPNDRRENQCFWEQLRERRLENVDAVLGDMNMVEQARDRLPEHGDSEGQVEAMADLMQGMGLVDGWRKEQPHMRLYSYMQSSTGSQSRIDRIYVKMQAAHAYDGWTTEEPGIPTDHRIVMVSVACRGAPFVGKGRWTMPVHLLNDELMVKKMRALGEEFVNEVEGIGERSPSRNAQVAYRTFKDKLVAAARQRAKEKVPKIDRQISGLKDNINAVLNGEGMLGRALLEEEVRTVAIMQDRLAKLEMKRFGSVRAGIATRHWAKSETISKYWVRSNAAP